MDLSQAPLALERIGKTDEQRLRWWIGFTKRNLKNAPAGALFDLSYELRAFVPSLWVHPQALGRPLSREQQLRLQKMAADCLRQLLGAPAAVWRLPSRHIFIWRIPAGNEQAAASGERRLAKRPQLRLMFKGTALEAIFAGFVDLLLRVGDRLRACKQCGAAFVARKRSDYCSLSCYYKAGNERRKK